MSRMLFVVPPLTGHVTPLAAVANQLVAGGNTVAWVGEPDLIRRFAGPDAQVQPCPAMPKDRAAQPVGLRGYAAMRQLWQDFLIPLADTMLETVLAAADRIRPDLIVADMQALAGPLAAAQLGLPWASSATTSAPLCQPLAATPKIREWLDGQLEALIERGSRPGARRLTPAELECSPDLVLAFSTEALVATPVAGQVRFVGPAIGSRTVPGPPFPLRQLTGRPLVLVTLGTVNEAVGSRFLAACAEAFTLLGDEVQGVIADPSRTGTQLPCGALSWPYLPMLDLLPRASAVICHGGHNTVCECLANGVPVIAAPIRDDQPVVADQLVRAGAGIRLHFAHATASTISAAVRQVRTEPGFASGAAAVRASFAAAGGAAAAARHLLDMAAGAPTGGLR